MILNFEGIKQFIKELKTDFSDVDNLTVNVIVNLPGTVPEPVDDPVDEPTDPPADDRNFGVGYAKAYPGKTFVNLWLKDSHNNVPVEDGGPGWVLKHQPVGEREQVPDAAKVVYLLDERILLDGGGYAYPVVGYGSDADIAKKLLDGSGLYIKESEME